MARVTPEFRIPPAHQPAVRHLAELPPEQVEAFRTALAEASPTFNLSDLARSAAERSGIEPQAARNIVDLIVSLYTAATESGLDMDDLINQLARAASDAFGERIDEWNPLKRNLAQLLSLDASIGVVAKALNVFLEHQSSFRTARIISDVRPIFSVEDTANVAAATVVHTLRIEYNDRHELRSFFVAMDANDLRALEREVKRALEKEGTLRSFVIASGVDYLDVRDLQE